MSNYAYLPVLLACCVLSIGLRAADADLAKEVEQLRKELDQFKKDKASDRAEIEGLKKQRSDAKAPISSAQASAENKYGPNAAVTTKQGKLNIGGLVQVWYYSIQNDTVGFFGDHPGTGTAVGGDTNEGKDNDSFAIRRTELRFTVDIHENVTAQIMIDPARAIAGRPAFPTNVGFFAKTPSGAVSTDISNPSYNGGLKLLKDAYINYHGVVPHHDFTVGQYKPFIGEEGIRPSAQLDFAERSMIGQLTDSPRDLGLTAHGTWWDDRFQYWLGVLDGAGTFMGSDPSNRVDDNDQKDFTYRILIRPVWKHETWGSLELGMSSQFGIHGEAGPFTDGLGRNRTNAIRHYAWGSYKPGGPVKGWWVKGEYAWIKDRSLPNTVASFNAATGYLSATGSQTLPHPFVVEGFYVATGYKISDSVFKDSAPGWLKNFEFAVRYEQFENVTVADLAYPSSRTDVFATDVWTAGINYYIKGDNAKIQLNYHVVDNPDANSSSLLGRTAATAPRHFRAVENNSLIVNFQVAW